MAFCEPVLEHQHEIVSNHRTQSLSLFYSLVRVVILSPSQYQPGFQDIKSLRISGVPFVIPRPQ